MSAVWRDWPNIREEWDFQLDVCIMESQIIHSLPFGITIYCISLLLSILLQCELLFIILFGIIGAMVMGIVFLLSIMFKGRK